MTFFPDPSTIVAVGGVYIRWFAVTALIGCILGYLYVSDKVKKHGYRQSASDDILMITLVAGILGGRLFWVLENWRKYRLYVWSVLQLNDGGFEIVGALFAIMFALLLYSKYYRMSFRRTTDTVILGVFVAITFGRLGKCLEVPSLWISVAMDAGCLALLWLMTRTYREGRRRGDVTALALILTGLTRAIGCVTQIDPTAENCMISCVLAVVAGLTLYGLSRSFPYVKPVILFDFDGTIMDSEYLVINCFAYLFQKHRSMQDFTKEVQREVFHTSLEEEIAKLFPNENTEVLVREYRNFQRDILGKHMVETLPHVKETVKELKDRGYVLGIVTGRITDSCRMWLKDLQIEQYFDVVAGTEQYRHSKPAPDGIIRACELMNVGHDACVYVGDTAADVECGKNAGVYTIGFVTDEEHREEVENAAPNHTIDSFDKILDILQEQHEWSVDCT